MRLLRRQPWRMSIHVRTKYLDLILRASRSFQSWNWKSSPLSLKIKLALKFCPNFFLPRSNSKQSRLGILRKFSFRPSSKKCLDFKSTSNAMINFAHEERICAGSVLIGLLSLMFESSSPRIRFLILLFRFITYLYCAFIFKKYLPARTWKALVILSMIAVFSWRILVLLSNVNDHVWKSLLHPLQKILMEFLGDSLKETLALLFNRFKLYCLL